MTVAQVARAAEVSLMTVSRVVNGDAGVAEATRQRVKAVIRDLGYVPNPAARSLASGRQCRIGLLYANPSSSYLSEFLVGALAEASERDAQLVIEQCEAGQDAEALVERLTRHRLDAVLLPPPMCDDAALVAALGQAGMAIVQVATGNPDPAVHAVTIDDEEAACAMTRRLIALGHRRIGYIAGNPAQTASALREKGYRRALEEEGLPYDPALVATGDYSYRSGLRAAALLLARAEPPTAVFAANDDMAAAVIAVAHRLGLEVPGDLSVCGFDDTAIATTVWPELTTVHQPVADMARLATRLLTDATRRSEPGTGPLHETLPFTLVERSSDGPPRKG